jgi:hypothetical protein
MVADNIKAAVKNSMAAGNNIIRAVNNGLIMVADNIKAAVKRMAVVNSIIRTAASVRLSSRMINAG